MLRREWLKQGFQFDDGFKPQSSLSTPGTLPLYGCSLFKDPDQMSSYRGRSGQLTNWGSRIMEELGWLVKGEWDLSALFEGPLRDPLRSWCSRPSWHPLRFCHQVSVAEATVVSYAAVWLSKLWKKTMKILQTCHRRLCRSVSQRMICGGYPAGFKY